MINVISALSAVLVMAAPFPAPWRLGVVDATKCDWATVTTVNSGKGNFIAQTVAGPVTFLTNDAVQVFSVEGRPVGSISALQPGQAVRVYYTVSDGARVGEVDLITDTEARAVMRK